MNQNEKKLLLSLEEIKFEKEKIKYLLDKALLFYLITIIIVIMSYFNKLNEAFISITIFIGTGIFVFTAILYFVEEKKIENKIKNLELDDN